MMKLLLLPVLIGFACCVAGLYGMIHNQISYTVAPEYFTAFKFRQFRISDTLPPRLGAALVGWQASWWMGALIGAPIGMATLFLPTLAQMATVFLRVTLLVVAITLALGCASLLIPVGPDIIALIPIPQGVVDSRAFARAGLMHDSSYLAGILALLIGLAWVLRSVRRARTAFLGGA